MKSNPEPDTRLLAVKEYSDRLDKYLVKVFPEVSRSYLQELIETGQVAVNNKNIIKPHYLLKDGDKITISFPPKTSVLVPEQIPLDIVYEDEDLIIIDKPAGMTVHPAPGHENHTLVNALLAQIPALADSGEPSRPGIVHRLDKDTSGLIVVAKNDASRQNLINQFKTRQVKKVYLALVKGRIEPEKGIIEAPIGRSPVNRKKMAVVEGGREASTRYKVVNYFKNYTLLEVMPETGRTHQIRVHLAAIDHPVIGDPVYGIKSSNLKRQFLHAFKLGLHLPSTGEYKEFTSELPDDLRLFLNKI